MTNLVFEVLGTSERLELHRPAVIVAGFTGRDQAHVQHHIEELVAIGVPAPESVPTFYPVDTGLATQSDNVRTGGSNTSGEVEPVLIRHGGRLYLSVGSDHTDRDIERDSIARSKEACPKPLGRQAIPLTDDIDWDAVAVACSVDGVLYQEGTLAALRIPTDVLAIYDDLSDSPGSDLIMFGGTLPLLNGVFIPGVTWELTLRAGATTLTHHYTVTIGEES